MSLADLELKDPQRVLDALAADISFDESGVWLVLVDEPATQQTVLAVRRLEAPDDLDDEGARRSCSDQLAEIMAALPIPPWGRHRRTVAVTVIVRPGYTIWGPIEKFWAMAWRYSNHLTDAIDTDTIVVTEHGWASLMLHEGAARPRLGDGSA